MSILRAGLQSAALNSCLTCFKHSNGMFEATWFSPSKACLCQFLDNIWIVRVTTGLQNPKTKLRRSCCWWCHPHFLNFEFQHFVACPMLPIITTPYSLHTIMLPALRACQGRTHRIVCPADGIQDFCEQYI